jgi:hypothetical protein
MTTRWARVARGFVAAVISLFVAIFSHILPGGNVPGALALLACLILSTLVCIALSGKKLSLFRLSAAVGVSQFLFHSVFSLSASVPSTAATPASLIHSGHLHEQVIVLGTSGVASIDEGMWLAHALAAVVTIVALRHGELAFWSLFRVARLWIGTLFASMTTPRPVEVPAVSAPRERAVLPHALILPLSPMRHRGPPAFHLTAV